MNQMETNTKFLEKYDWVSILKIEIPLILNSLLIK